MQQIEFILKQLFAAYPNVEESRATTAVYYRLLKDIPPDLLQAAVDQAIIDSPKFLPGVGEIRRIYIESLEPESSSAVEQWDLIKQAFRSVGYMGKPTFEDPITTEIVRQWGWEAMCANEEPEGVVFKRFADHYNAVANRNREQARWTPAYRQLMERNGPIKRLGYTLPEPPEWARRPSRIEQARQLEDKESQDE